MARTTLLIGFVASLLFVSLLAYSLPVFAQGQDNPGKPEVIAVSGIVPGKNLLVHILLEVPPGADKNQAAAAALYNHGARPFTADEYSLTGLVWDQFSDSDPGNDKVIQRYNPQNDPTGGNGITALLNTHTSWNNVATSSFTFEYGGETGKCPSLVQECKGRQTFDGNNDVAWLALRDANTLGVTWSGTGGNDEADMALNTNFSWATDGVNHYDVETVFLHENGHVTGLSHSEDISAIMYPSYQNVNRDLQQDDIDGITFLYPGTSTPTNNSPTVTISTPDNSSFDSITEISFTGSASDIEDGDLTANLSWTSNLDGSIGTGGSFSNSLSDGTHSITAQVTDAGGKTGSDSITVTVGTPPVTGTTVGVDSITYSGSGGKNNDRHLTVTVNVSDDSGNNVSGATVSITLVNGASSWTATGTTDTTGGVGFTLKNAPSGTYTTEVTNLVASGLTWDGITPSNTYTK
ncbi:MAG: matrixin family metalloprotease [Nitrosopumilus sp.]|nr:matrixin family metalloprotease [Nitrosopumilus sp.]